MGKLFIAITCGFFEEYEPNANTNTNTNTAVFLTNICYRELLMLCSGLLLCNCKSNLYVMHVYCISRSRRKGEVFLKVVVCEAFLCASY